MTLMETLFYAEAEGLLPTRAGKINAVINAAKKYPYSRIEFSELEKLLESYGLKYSDLSEREIRYIIASIG